MTADTAKRGLIVGSEVIGRSIAQVFVPVVFTQGGSRGK